VPVLVSRTGSFEELPDDAVGKVDIDDTEEDLLLEYLLLLARSPEIRRAMARNARRYVAEHHTLQEAAGGYLEFLLSMRGIESEIALPPAPPTEPASIPEVTSPPGDKSPALFTSIVIPQFAPQAAPRQPAGPQAIPEYDRPTDFLSLAAEAAIEIGVDEEDQAVLSELARRVAELE
jgi:hypothetical protein